MTDLRSPQDFESSLTAEQRLHFTLEQGVAVVDRIAKYVWRAIVIGIPLVAGGLAMFAIMREDVAATKAIQIEQTRELVAVKEAVSTLAIEFRLWRNTQDDRLAKVETATAPDQQHASRNEMDALRAAVRDMQLHMSSVEDRMPR